MIRCKGLCKSFDGVHALVNLDFQFPPTGIIAIIGPNGAGKTTLVNALTGFVRPDTGQCFLGELEITHLAAHRIARLGMARTFQDMRLIHQISAVDNVLLACPCEKGEQFLGALLRIGVAAEETRNREQASRCLRFVGLDSIANKPAGELSYGQQKLLSLACCLATEATVLLLDEPVAGVHPEMAGQILDLMRQLRRDGKLLVFIEHDMSAVKQTAEWVIVMDEGKIIAQGQPRDVLERADILEAYLG